MTIAEFKSLPKPRRKPVQRESQLQQSCVLWFRRQYPQYANLLYSIPNEGKRTPRNGARMKAMGRVSGIPDLMLAIARKGHHGLFIEMKYGNGTLSKEQSQMALTLEMQGYYVELANTLDNFQTVINTYLS